MADKLTPTQRHHCMSRIRGKDTRPEVLVRQGLHARGFRFRLQDRRLPGRPDITLPKWGVAIMVNGCFWHGHKGCRYATKPQTNPEFWEAKIARNRHRDEVTEAHLEALGWMVITVWECELKGREAAEERLATLAEEIRQTGERRKQWESQRKISRLNAKREREKLLARQKELEEEIKRKFPIPTRIKNESKNE